MEQRFLGNYRGIVVQNNDPEGNGRVKVWVPHVNAAMYDEWNQLASDKVRTDITTAKHVFLGQNVLSNVSTILSRLKEKLPWSEICQPVIGGGASAFFHSPRSIKTPIDDASQSINDEGEYQPGGIAKVSFGSEELTNVHSNCLTDQALTLQLQRNLQRSTQQVEALTDAKAAQFAQSGGSTDVSQASVPPIDPSPIEPLKTVARGENVQPLGPTGSPIESDACGASNQHVFTTAPVRDEFHQQGTDSANNNRVNPFSHLFRPPPHNNTARGSFSIPSVGAVVWVFFEGGDPNYPVVWGVIYGSDDYKSVWNTKSTSTVAGQGQVQDAYGQEVDQGNSPDYPSNYENREVSDTQAKDNTEDNVYRSKWAIIERGGSIEIVSTTERELVRLAHHSGAYFEFNKLCTSRLATQNDQTLVLKDQFETIHGFKSVHVNKDYDQIIFGDRHCKLGDVRKWKPHSDAIKQIMRPIHDTKRLFDVDRTSASTDTSPQQSQSGENAPCPVCNGGPSYVQIVTNAPDTIVKTDQLVTVQQCNTQPDLWGTTGIAIEPGSFEYKALAGNGSKMYADTCWCCGGTGKSPSTQDGQWNASSQKAQLADKIEQTSLQLLEHERELGRPEHREGGNSIDIISKNKTTVVGLTFNDFESYRKDPVGKLVPYGIKVDAGGVYPQYKASPLVEQVHVGDLAGGDYDLFVTSKYNVNVGGGGIRLKTTGNMLLGGQIVQIFAESINIGTRSEYAIDAGERFDVEADAITFRPRLVGETRQVGVFGNLNISQNLITRGAAHIEGELSVHHVTAPREWHLTEVEPKITQAHLKEGYIIGVCECGPVTSVCAPYCIEVNPHVHWKADPAWTLVETNDEVRASGARLNKDTVVAAHPVKSVETYAEQVYPQGTRGRFEEGTHWQPQQAPGGEDAAMQPDPAIGGFGEGTSETSSETGQSRTKSFDQIAEQMIADAKKAESTTAQFDRPSYDVAMISGFG